MYWRGGGGDRLYVFVKGFFFPTNIDNGGLRERDVFAM